jgi:hypothetical protein
VPLDQDSLNKLLSVAEKFAQEAAAVRANRDLSADGRARQIATLWEAAKTRQSDELGKAMTAAGKVHDEARRALANSDRLLVAAVLQHAWDATSEATPAWGSVVTAYVEQRPEDASRVDALVNAQNAGPSRQDRGLIAASLMKPAELAGSGGRPLPPEQAPAAASTSWPAGLFR